MGFLDGVIDNVKKEAEDTLNVLARDWFQGIRDSKDSGVKSAPPPAGTLPADVLAAQRSMDIFKYMAVAAGVFLILSFVFKKKGGKK